MSMVPSDNRHKGSPLVPEYPSGFNRLGAADRRPTFTKVFRWRLPDGHTQPPATVEIVGTFTDWERLALTRDSALDAWHVTIHHIQGHRVHHYMLLVDGQPAADRFADGVAVPHGPQEEHYQLHTPRGPRVFMLFAQSK